MSTDPNDYAHSAPGQQMAYAATQVGGGMNQVGDTLKTLLQLKMLRGLRPGQGQMPSPGGAMPSAGMPNQAGAAGDSGMDQTG